LRRRRGLRTIQNSGEPIPTPGGETPMQQPLLLALDIGTSSTRSAFFGTDGERLEETTAQQSYELITTPDGGAELDPSALLDAVRLCLRQTIHLKRDTPRLRDATIAGIGTSCFWHSLIGVDAARAPLTRIITWADARGRADAAALRKELDEPSLHARTGCMLRTSFWPAKLAWLHRADGDTCARVEQWMSPAEWLQLQLAGGANCAIGMATGTGLFNPTSLAWDTEILERLALSPAKLRPLSDEPLPVAGELAELFPELAGVPWFPAVGDGAASNLGSGATQPGLAAINVGTSAAVRVMREGAVARAPLGLFCYRVDASRYLVGGAVSNAGNLRAWCVRELHLPDDAALESALAARQHPVAGLHVLPFWTAERAPAWNEEATGAISGVTQHTTALDLFQAIIEAGYHQIARISELILRDEPRAPRFVVSGGIQQSPQALQRLANVLGEPVHPNEEMEASLRGAAIYAIEKLGWPSPPARFSTAVDPDRDSARLYAEARERQRSLETLLGTF